MPHGVQFVPELALLLDFGHLEIIRSATSE
jgi:hypothetical protein